MKRNDATSDVEQYARTVRMRRELGMRGYGVYSRLLELIEAAPNGRLKADFDDFAFDMHEETDFVRRVVEEYGLFEIADGCLIAAGRETPEEREAKEAKRKKRQEAAKRGAATRKTRAALRDDPEPVPAQVAEQSESTRETVVVPFDEPDDGETLEEPPEMVRLREVSEIWNDVFKGTRRIYKDLTPSQKTWGAWQDVLQYAYSNDDFREAFEQAQKDKFTFMFGDAIKRDNMARLLANAERDKHGGWGNGDGNGGSGGTKDLSYFEELDRQYGLAD